MARINFPNNFAKLVKLFTDFKTKYDAEAGSSVTQPFLDEQGIDPVTDLAAVNIAVAANTAFEKAERDSEQFTEERDDLFEPVFGHHKDCVQFLKKLFRGTPAKLGEWGQTVDSDDRVVYPSDFMGRTVAVYALITKHGTFPVGTSPLQPYLDENDIVLADNKSDTDDAVAAHNNFLAQDILKEQKREERDSKMIPVAEHLRGIGQFLVGLYSATPHKAGEWGFIIDDSPQANKIRVGEINPGATKTIRNLTVGKTFKNIGNTSFNLYSGEETEGTALVLNPGTTFTIVRGFGIMTVINTSEADKGVYEGEFNQ